MSASPRTQHHVKRVAHIVVDGTDVHVSSRVSQKALCVVRDGVTLVAHDPGHSLHLRMVYKRYPNGPKVKATYRHAVELAYEMADCIGYTARRTIHADRPHVFELYRARKTSSRRAPRSGGVRKRLSF